MAARTEAQPVACTHRGRRVTAAVILVLMLLVTAACGSRVSTNDAGRASVPGSLRPAPPSQVPPLLTQQQVDNALGKLDGLVQDAMNRTGVPGVAVAVVHQDKVVYLKGFGVREAGKPDMVDPETVFQLASVSKPLASTVVAGVVGRKTIAWDDPVIAHNPSFSLKDPYITRNATFADLLSHRSGLHTGAGDLLEDLGFDRTYILSHLNQQPLDPFRSSYNYSNFGYTEGAQAAADAVKMSWEDLAQQSLFTPLHMTETSYRHADYQKAPDKALLHVPVGNNTWVAEYSRNPDAEAPAGGASSSVRDLAQWVRLQLGNGSYDGKQIIDPDALAMTHVPHSISGLPSTFDARAHFYGLGWNVSYDDQARLQLGHSGAFNLGAATSASLLPGEQLGILVLTNGRPQGIPEAIGAGFFDVARNAAPTVDWLSFAAGQFQQLEQSEKPTVNYSTSPPRPNRAAPTAPTSAPTPTPTTGHSSSPRTTAS